MSIRRAALLFALFIAGAGALATGLMAVINTAVAEGTAYEWLHNTWQQGARAYNDRMLDDLAHDAGGLSARPAVAEALAANRWADLDGAIGAGWRHRMPGEHWIVAAGDHAESSLASCASADVARRLAGRDRAIVLCGDTPVMAATHPGEVTGRPRLYLGRVLGDTYVDELSRVTGAEIALSTPAGDVATSVVDASGRRVPMGLSPDEVAATRVEGASYFGPGVFRVDDYRGYMGISEALHVGDPSFDVYLYATVLEPVDGDASVRVLLAAPRSILDLGATQSTAAIGIIAIILVAALTLSGRILVRRFADDAGRLADAVARLGRGEDDVRVGTLRGGGELQIIARAFDDMADNLAVLRGEQAAGAASADRRAKEICAAFAELHRTHEALRVMQGKLIDASRYAGMAEVATNVIHNVGNVLNTVNVAAEVARRRILDSRLTTLERVVALLPEEPQAAALFVGTDTRGQQVPKLLKLVAQTLRGEQEEVASELEVLSRSIDHIKSVVRSQQQMASFRGGSEVVAPSEVVDMAIALQGLGQAGATVDVTREYAPVEPQLLDRHRVLQILMNLLANARHAVRSAECGDPLIVVRVGRDGEHLRIEVSDNGIGIKPALLDRIFQHGFTTKIDGHGFGLHSSANAAVEMGGTLTARSNGAGRGATFVLLVPLRDVRRTTPASGVAAAA